VRAAKRLAPQHPVHAGEEFLGRNTTPMPCCHIIISFPTCQAAQTRGPKETEQGLITIKLWDLFPPIFLLTFLLLQNNEIQLLLLFWND
jgi:hypothetical protein